MKIAVFHDFFNTIGGGERVAVMIARSLNADIITTDINIPKTFFSGLKVHSLGATSQTAGMRQSKALLKFLASNLSDEYDFYVFSGNWAHHASFHHHPSMMYCHTPVRALYDLYDLFLHRQSVVCQPAYAAWSSCIRVLDQRSFRRIAMIIANSQNTQKRIRRYYQRDAEIIYPPVDTKKYLFGGYGNFWLSVNRLYPEKRIELQIDAFSRIPEENLIIVGGCTEGDHAHAYADLVTHKIQEISNKNITMRGQISEEELIDLYATCKGLICTAMDEDFGMTPLEAMASGKPVIAVHEGGFLETVTPECGIFVRPGVNDIVHAVRAIARDPERYRQACMSQASLFDLPIFNTSIQKAAIRTYNQWFSSV